MYVWFDQQWDMQKIVRNPYIAVELQWVWEVGLSHADGETVFESYT